MKKKWFKKTMALVLAGCMMAQTPVALAAEINVSPKADEVSRTVTTPTAEEATGTVTPAVTEEVSNTQAPAITQEEVSAEVPTATPGDAPTDTQDPIEMPAPAEVPGATPESAVKPPVQAEAKIQVVYSDEHNLSNRRKIDGGNMFRVYADGVVMENQPSVTLDKETPAEGKGGVQVYTYTIHGLPIYRADKITPVTYTVREKETPKGYTAFAKEIFAGMEAQEAAALMDDFVSPEDEVTLTLNKEKTALQAEKKFGNYLPAFVVQGTIAWPAEHTGIVRPEMEAYFKDQYTVLRDGEPYNLHKITFTQDESDADKWHYEVKGLFIVKEDGNAASYTVKAAEAEGMLLDRKEYNVNKEISKDFTYTAVSVTPDTEDTQAIPAPGDAVPEEPQIPADTFRAAGTTDVSMIKEWRDNNDVNRPVQQLIGSGGIQIYFAIADGEAVLLTDDNKAAIGLDEATQIPAITAISSGTSKTTYTCSGLPASVGTGEQQKTITYELRENPDVAENLGYKQEVETGKDGKKTVYNMKTKAFTAKLALKNGGLGGEPSTSTNYTLYTLDGRAVEGATGTWNAETESYTIPNLPMYTKEGGEIVYYLRADAPPENPTKDYYLPEYDNKAVPNHGTNIKECYDGGTINLTLTGQTAYTGTKAWLDGGEVSQRPDGTFYLWRYTGKPGNGYAQASQVRDAANKLITLELKNDSGSYTFTVGAESKDYDYALPKYDPEGYPYVYLMRETLSGENAGLYQQVFGEVTENEDGTFTVRDTLPEGVTRNGPDASLYNGGTLSNRRTGSENVKTEKTWKAAAYQSNLKEVAVTMQLQKRPAKSEEAWTPVTDSGSGSTVEKTVTGFTPEEMTKSIAAGAPAYDELGRELEYRWVETSVTENGGGNLLKTDKEGNITFNLSCNPETENVNDPENENINTEHFTSGEEWIDEKDHAKGKRVVNRLVGTEDYTIDKIWNDGEGNAADAPAGASITVGIYRNDELHLTYKMDGRVDSENKETKPWHIYVDDLPKYDEEGHEYTYIAEEIGGYPGYHSEYVFNEADRETEITNTPGPGGPRIRVQKKWIDDSDISHRESVTVEVRKKSDHSLVKTVELSKANNWWSWVGVDEGTDYQAYYLEETKVGGAVPQTDGGVTTVTTPNHVYDVTYGKDAAKNMLTVTNRRIGVIDLTVTKKWIDRGQEDNDRPEAKLVLQCVEYPDAIDAENDTTTVTDENIPIGGAAGGQIQDNEGNQAKAVQEVVRTAQESTYYFHNLPKYDKDGKVIHYTVEERQVNVGDFSDKGYNIDIGQGGYEVGQTHTDDQQAVTVTNKRSGTKSITFHKKWEDVYAYENGKRPDIYLTLWQLDSVNLDEGGNPKPVKVNGTGFENYLWKADVADDNYYWTSTFDNVPKYDDNGQEIFYYAQESMSADGSQFDYNRVEYLDESGNPAETGDKTIIKIQQESEPEITVLKEGGTFVNGIENDAVIEGHKLWKNLPQGFPAAKLPNISIYLDQYLSDDEDAKPVEQEISIITHDALTQVGDTNNFIFKITKHGTDNPELKETLPKYDEDGRLYIYKVRETITHELPDTLTVWDELFYADTNAFTISNFYDDQEGKNAGYLIVKKHWVDLPEGETKYPAVTFNLYRRELTSEDGITTPELVETKTIDWDGYTENTGEVIFEGLTVYRPDGEKYQYYVKETALGGYVGSAAKVGTKDNPGGEYIEGFISEDFTIRLETGTEPTGTTPQVDFKNMYETDKIILQGEKVWNDYSDSFHTRPQDIELTLYRSAPKQPGQDNAFGEEKVESVSIAWEGKNTDRWSYEIENLDKYAPNGQLWEYRIEESKVEGYNDDKVQSVKHETVNDNTIIMKPLTNSLYGKAVVEKVWEDDGNKYNLRPTSVSVKLQVKIGDGAWTDAKVTFAELLGENYKFEAKLSSSNNWRSYTFKNLPLSGIVGESGSSQTMEYRVVETHIDGESVWNEQTQEYETEGQTYVPSGETTGNTTTITNTMSEDTSISLDVTKIWQDSSGIYDTRPMDGKNWSLDFKLERKLESGKDWLDVLDPEGDLVRLNITGSMTEHTTKKTFANLPKYDTDGNTYEYRAVEARPAGYLEPVYTSDLAVNTTEVKNTLDKAADFSAVKTWEDGKGSHPEVTFELKYSTDAGANWRSFTEKAAVTLDGTADDKGEKESWKAVWAGLPKTKDGQNMAYTVVETKVPDGYWKTDFNAEKSEIINTLTGFYLNKQENLTDGSKKDIATDYTVGYGIYKKDGTTLVATWTQKKDGNKVTESVKPEDGTSVAEVSETAKAQIQGLPIGRYMLREIKAPEGYLTAGDTAFEVKTDGTVAFTGTVGTEQAAITPGEPVADQMITLYDELLRGDAKLTKYMGKPSDGQTLAGVSFDLYQKDANEGPGKKIAENLVTNEDGVLTMKGQPDTVKFIDGPDQGKQVNIGLRKGVYYLQESGATADSVLDTSIIIEFEIQPDADPAEQPEQKQLEEVENQAFAAAVQFVKIDAADGRPVGGAVFKLKYTPDTPAGNAVGYDGDAAHTYTTDADGKISMTGLTKGSYVLTEESAEGYDMSKKFVCTFNIVEKDNGKTLDLSNTDGFTQTSGEASASTKENLYRVHNTRIPGSVAIKKVNDDEEPAALNGAVFELTKTKEADGESVTPAKTFTCKFESGKVYKVDGDDFAEDSSVTGKAGQVLINGLDWGTYTLQETKAPDGYILDKDAKPVTFAITRKNRDLTAETDGHKVINVRNSLNLQKTDTDGTTSLAGAEFTLEPVGKENRFADGTNAAKTLTDPAGIEGEPGKWLMEGWFIAGHTYKLTETKAPLGYEMPAPAEFSFTMNADGTITPEDALPDHVKVSRDKRSIQVQNKKIAVKLRKCELNGAEISGSILDGTAFEIKGTFKTAQNGTETTTKTVTAQNGTLNTGMTVLDGLWLASTGSEEGVNQYAYTIAETTAPKGYEIPENAATTFIVGMDGKVTLTGDNDLFTRDDKDGSTIRMWDKTVELNIIKTDESDAPIGDETRGYAEFSVEGIFADAAESQTITGSTEVADGVSDLQKKLSGKLAAGSTYKATETKAPDGYILPSPALSADITVEKNGTITLQAGADSAFSVDNTGETAAISVKNSPIALSIEKTDMDGTVIQNRGAAEFEIQPAGGEAFADGGTEPIRVTTEQGGTNVLTGKLKPNTEYIMTETKAPAGYELAEEFGFKVDAQGRVKIASGSTHVTANENEITVKDREIEAKLIKTDKGGNKLDGAEFTVNGEFANTTDEAIEINSNDSEALYGELIAGETYIITEVTAPDGYKLPVEELKFQVNADGTFASNSESITIEAGAGADDTVAAITVQDEMTYISFNKIALYNESCLDQTLGNRVPDPDATVKMPGVRFTAYSDKELKNPVQTAVSDANGLVEFWKLPLGTYYIKETATQKGYVPDENVYTAEVTSKEIFDGLKLDGQAVELNTLVNDVVRADLTFIKVSEQDPSKVIKGATYGLYKRADELNKVTFAAGKSAGRVADAKEILIATAVTDKEGRLSFHGVLMNTRYTVKELAAADGSYISARPITVVFTVGDDGVPAIDRVQSDFGGGTAELDRDGNLVWNEPQTQAAFQKTDMSGKPLAGAVFELQDSEGKAIEITGADGKKATSWTSEKEALTVIGELTAGQTYRLVEKKAPAGYKLAEPVEFTIPDEKVEANANKVIKVQMKDEAIKVALLKTEGTGKTALAGAYFSLKGKFADGSTAKTITSTSSAYDLSGMLIGKESYELTELKAPNGYIGLKTPVRFTVDENGVIKITDGNGAKLVSVTEKDGVCTIVFKNKKVITPTKPGTTPKPGTSATIKSAETGDSQDVLFYLALLAASCIASGEVLRRRLKKYYKK